MTSEEIFEPDIIGFLCNWCSYASADLAGVSRFQYPPNVRVIRVMCSARVDPTIVVEAFVRGLDGVMVLGCHLGTCHYMTGNYFAEKRMKTTKNVLKKIGLSPDRLLVDWVSAAEGERFATLVKDFTETVRKLGPLGNETDLEPQELKTRLVAGKEVLAQEKIRWLVGRERELIEDKNAFGEKISQEEFDQLMLRTIENEFSKRRILKLIRDQPLSVADLSERLETKPKEIFDSLMQLKNEGSIDIVGFKNDYPLFQAIGSELPT